MNEIALTMHVSHPYPPFALHTYTTPRKPYRIAYRNRSRAYLYTREATISLPNKINTLAKRSANRYQMLQLFFNENISLNYFRDQLN